MYGTHASGGATRAIRREIEKTRRKIAKLQRNLNILEDVEARVKTMRSALNKEETTLGGKRNMVLHRGRGRPRKHPRTKAAA